MWWDAVGHGGTWGDGGRGSARPDPACGCQAGAELSWIQKPKSQVPSAAQGRSVLPGPGSVQRRSLGRTLVPQLIHDGAGRGKRTGSGESQGFQQRSAAVVGAPLWCTSRHAEEMMGGPGPQSGEVGSRHPAAPNPSPPKFNTGRTRRFYRTGLAGILPGRRPTSRTGWEAAADTSQPHGRVPSANPPHPDGRREPPCCCGRCQGAAGSPGMRCVRKAPQQHPRGDPPCVAMPPPTGFQAMGSSEGFTPLRAELPWPFTLLRRERGLWRGWGDAWGEGFGFSQGPGQRGGCAGTWRCSFPLAKAASWEDTQEKTQFLPGTSSSGSLPSTPPLLSKADHLSSMRKREAQQDVAIICRFLFHCSARSLWGWQGRKGTSK